MYDLVVRGGTVYGAGPEPVRADLAVAGDRVVEIGDLTDAEAAESIEAAGKVVAPGFINVLSHSYFTVLHDPRSLSELVQGVTTQIFGEGNTMGPLTPEMATELERVHRDLDLHVSWDRLSGFLNHVERRGCTQNVASFVGFGALRGYAVGYDDRPATAAEIDTMRGLLAEEMADGALGLATALIYPPESYAPTVELIALARTAAARGGGYISHIRGEGADLLEAIGEVLTIASDAELPAEIYHLKAAGQDNWPLMTEALAVIERARAAGSPVTADVYPYTASSTGLSSIIPDRFHEGGAVALYDRLADPDERAAIAAELRRHRRWGDTAAASDVLILGVREESNRRCQGMTLAAIAEERGIDPVDAALDLIGADRSRVTSAFFSMSEDNLREQLRRPWVSVCSDASSMAPEGVSLRAPTHPRAYGSFARILARYVREQRVLGLGEAIDRMTRLPAANLGLRGRGSLAPGSYADIVVFDPDTITDTATFTDPHQLATGVSDVVVNGQPAIAAGRVTGRLPGRRLRRS